MGVLEQVIQMKGQGVSDQEIVSNLQQQGVPPKQINDALNQAQIKSAVSDVGIENMQSSITNNDPNPSSNPPQEEFYEPSDPLPAGSYDSPAYEPSTQETYPEDYSQQEYYPEEAYGDYGGGVDDTTTMIEVAEQVFSEKIRLLQKKVDNMDEFRNIAQTKLETLSNRLKKIETTIDKLQIAILEKVGSYGGTLESIKKEMAMMQDSFGKMVKHSTKSSTSRKK